MFNFAVIAVRMYLTLICTLNDRFVTTSLRQDNSTADSEGHGSVTTSLPQGNSTVDREEHGSITSWLHDNSTVDSQEHGSITTSWLHDNSTVDSQEHGSITTSWLHDNSTVDSQEHGSITTSWLHDNSTVDSQEHGSITTSWLHDNSTVDSQEHGSITTSWLHDNSTVDSEEHGSITTYFTTDQSRTIFTGKSYIYSSTNAPILDDRCNMYGSCGFPEKKDPWYCQCDGLCEEYNECCLGYSRRHYTTERSRYECQSITTDPFDIKGYFAISVCPDGYTDGSVKDKCSHGNIPKHGPSVVHNNSQIYKNKYCAICNNVTDFVSFDMQFYNLKLESEDFENYTRLAGFQKLNFTYFNADHKVLLSDETDWRFCVSKQIETTDPYCQMFTNPVFVEIKRKTYFYRNINCAPIEFRKRAICVAKVASIVITTAPIKGLSVIFSFRNSANVVAENGICSVWSKEVAATGKCTDLETYQNYVINIEYYLKSNFNHTEEELILFALLSVFSMEVANLTRFNNRIYIDVAANSDVARVTAQINIVKRSFIHEIQGIRKEIAATKVMRILVKDNASRQNSKITILSKPTFAVNNNETNFHTVFTVSIIGIDTLQSFLLINDINVSNVAAKRLCRNMVFDVQKQENQFLVKSYNCNVSALPGTNELILPILTYICSSLSVISLLVLIVYNRRRKLYLNIPGSNLENLSLSLMLSYVVFMAGIGFSSIRRLCYIIGVILHYLWLSVFSFMTISVVFIVMTLVQIKARNTMSDEETTNRRRAFTILGLLLPILFVAPAVGVDQYGPRYLSSGYGKSVCFPNQYPGNVIFFSGPVMLAVFSNSISLVHIIIQISKVRNEMRNIRKSVPFQDAKAYLRITVLSGVFWITGVLAAVLDSEWLDYVFTICCGLQGFSIAVANLTTTQVRAGKKTETGSDVTNKPYVKRM